MFQVQGDMQDTCAAATIAMAPFTRVALIEEGLVIALNVLCFLRADVF